MSPSASSSSGIRLHLPCRHVVIILTCHDDDDEDDYEDDYEDNDDDEDDEGDDDDDTCE